MHQPETLLWFFTLVGQWALWSAVTPYLVSEIDDTVKVTRPPPMEWLKFAVAAATLLLLTAIFLVPTTFMASFPHRLDWWPFWSLASYPLGHRTLKIGVQTAAGFSIALLVVGAIWLNRFAAGAQLKPPPDASGASSPRTANVATYLDRRERLQLLTWIGGAILFLATLSVGALRAALVAYETSEAALVKHGALLAAQPSYHDPFPPEFPLIYGVFLSVLFALVCLPAQAAVEELGNALRDQLCPDLDKKDEATITREAYVQWQADRDDVSKALRLRTASETIRGVGFLLIPLGGSLVSLLLAK